MLINIQSVKHGSFPGATVYKYLVGGDADMHARENSPSSPSLSYQWDQTQI